MKRKVLITTVALATLTLAACHRPSDDADYMRNSPNMSSTQRDSRDNRGDSFVGNDDDGYLGDDNAGNGSGNGSENDYTSNYGNDNARNDNRSSMDPHYDFVNDLGFENITNTTGDSYYRTYRLDTKNAADNDVFHGWRHTWVDPEDYMDKDIDVYRYTGDYNGQNRTVHILSHRGTPIGGYHFGEGESAEHASMIDRDGFASRVADDFRDTWDDIFDIKH